MSEEIKYFTIENKINLRDMNYFKMFSNTVFNVIDNQENFNFESDRKLRIE